MALVADKVRDKQTGRWFDSALGVHRRQGDGVADYVEL
jgi:hypothetical protein